MSQLEDREKRGHDLDRTRSTESAVNRERPKEPRPESSTGAQKSEKPQPAADLLPHITLPKGGGAIRGMGEKFSVNAATGTAAFSIPLPLSPGRFGFTPQLGLSYDSGSGNGPFGFGWSLSLPAITRKTDKGLPRYCDSDESDVFILSGAEDLVPVLDPTGKPLPTTTRTVHRTSYEVHSYRPRIEGLFARIERWVASDTGISHWRSISRENVTTLYGFDARSRVADPDDPTRIFSYRICRSWDDKGNVAAYDYIPEDGAGIDQAQAHEANRTGPVRGAQTYLASVRYGNIEPYFPTWTADGSETPLPTKWMFEVVLDYGAHAPNAPTPKPDPSRSWTLRPDPFSTYRAGFEVRTYRRVHRLLFFNNAPKRYRYTDKERDEESDLYHHSTRYYAPWLGRWTACDPAELADGVNLYCYCRGNPIVFIDSRGTQSKRIFKDENQRVAWSTPNELSAYIKSLSPEDRAAFRDKTTGSFRERVQAHIHDEKREIAYRLPEVNIEAPSLARMKNEVEQEVKAEPFPPDQRAAAFDISTPEHKGKVIKAINYFLLATETENQTKLAHLYEATEELVGVRDKGFHQRDPMIPNEGLSQSIILRDAERYFYGSTMSYSLSKPSNLLMMFTGIHEEGKSKNLIGEQLAPYWEFGYNKIKQIAFATGLEKRIRSDPAHHFPCGKPRITRGRRGSLTL